ncbi:hypothetical protein K461DRAFT_279390 [Myriangium duriaei CBS 260.36]|uniref:AN1-type domain-containing protein n=1 Tax=Myriangium duriaei CBS 260.36 TaxID=1168546 RepID=A0A9P4J1T1_9PEZI|nr:hypothetical protein K461DRAFT_279390 [Myriangium duriaei CBS 260.36]
MVSSSTPEPPDAQSSYTKMSVGDVEAIGAHCQMTFCRQLDFLPFRCESCQGKFCLDHRSETAHSCVKAGAWSQRRAQLNAGSTTPGYRPSPKPSVLTHEQQCSETSCKTLIDTPLVTGVHCANCNRRYCLKHRFREDHDCKNLQPLGARPQLEAQREKGLAALNKLRAWGAAKASSVSMPQSKSKAAAAIQLKAVQDLKRTAKGDDKVPPEKRVYVHVEAEKQTLSAKIQNGKFFYSKEWSVGRVLDMAAKSLQVQNTNNRGGGEEEKLRVFHVEGGRILEFSEKLGTSVQTGNTIVLLRGVGPAVPDLIEM